ncbi:hypothetical protein [Accumulibacter sp.]|uniref:hypothetical protein n=1 Tax=Accumulibacter sp. TaxID=2053492 RepID=UPI001D73E498|nr:hypothetical protein [Accumulibacter sp.]MCB1932746.1 hypothetical protein [Accumulibacter sp.]MCP5227802.1 hypothetical protein [Accumulibacter sp.]
MFARLFSLPTHSGPRPLPEVLRRRERNGFPGLPFTRVIDGSRRERPDQAAGFMPPQTMPQAIEYFGNRFRFHGPARENPE